MCVRSISLWLLTDFKKYETTTKIVNSDRKIYKKKDSIAVYDCFSGCFSEVVSRKQENFLFFFFSFFWMQRLPQNPFWLLRAPHRIYQTPISVSYCNNPDKLSVVYLWMFRNDWVENLSLEKNYANGMQSVFHVGCMLFIYGCVCACVSVCVCLEGVYMHVYFFGAYDFFL